MVGPTKMHQMESRSLHAEVRLTQPPLQERNKWGKAAGQSLLCPFSQFRRSGEEHQGPESQLCASGEEEACGFGRNS